MVLKKIKLAQLSKAELGQRELNRLVGGVKCCICGCPISSASDINNSNTQEAYQSYYGTGGGAFA